MYIYGYSKLYLFSKSNEPPVTIDNTVRQPAGTYSFGNFVGTMEKSWHCDEAPSMFVVIIHATY